MSNPINSGTSAKWYVELTNKFSALAATLGLPDDMSFEIKNFMFEIARAQYLAGNRSGIIWLRKQQSGATATA